MRGKDGFDNACKFLIAFDFLEHRFEDESLNFLSSLLFDLLPVGSLQEGVHLALTPLYHLVPLLLHAGNVLHLLLKCPDPLLAQALLCLEAIANLSLKSSLSLHELPPDLIVNF